MNLTNPRELRPLLERHGFRFSKGLGQNFLVDASVPRRIAEYSGIGPGHCVLEIGPGVGCLTKELSRRAGLVLAVEKDARLLPVLAETLADCGNVEVVHADILKLGFAELFSRSGELVPAACANLPYNITSPVITKLLESRLFENLTLMVQREVAERLRAQPKTSAYGAFTVFVNWYAHPEILFSVPPSCFMPEPRVTSAVIRLSVRKAPPGDVPSEELFFRVTRAAFAQRRKTLLNALAAGLGGIPKEAVAEAIKNAGLPEKTRGEELGIEEFARLTRELYG